MRALPKLDLLRPPTDEARIREMLAHVREHAENRPAVYRMVAADGEVVYVGKSKQLRSRLLSYFRGVFPDDKGARIGELTASTPTVSETRAPYTRRLQTSRPNRSVPSA